MDTTRLLRGDIEPTTRTKLEELADQLEVVARLDRTSYVVDEGNNDSLARNFLFATAWQLKQLARVGTASYNV